MYDTVQLPDESVQDGELNMPPVFPSLHDMVPVGVVGELEVSVTVTVNVTWAPEFTVDGFGVTVVVVEWI